ncbi:MAG: HEAT repeat domain-containing protein, partial [Planctomycetes bacterium]|nr:HEAT repeat domain-containing protein [Planctomycetota bacterium]
MANPLAKRLIAIVAACVAAGSLSAQDDDLFKQALRKLRLNDREAALSLLTEYLATNPGNEEAFDLWTKVDSDEWMIMVNEGGEFAKIAKHLMTLASSGRREISRDADKIRELVATATSSEDFAERTHAMAELASDHSEFAVPALIAVLGNPDEDKGQDYAMLTLQRIGSPAVLPLVEALASDSDLLRRNIAASLVHIGDPRAAGALAKLASEDKNEAVREIARAGLEKFGVAAGTNAVDIFLGDAQDYLTGVGLRGLTPSEVVWTFDDGQLVAHDVPSEVFHLELAKKAAHMAMSMDPANDAAKALLARSYLAEVAAIEETLAANPDNEAVQALSAKIPALRMVAMTTGPATLRQALTDSMRDHMVPTAVATIEALSDVETPSTIGDSPLLTALDDDASSAIGYAAALAITKVSGDSASIPDANKVVEVLSRAVNEKGRRLVKVIGGGERAETAARSASATKSDVRVTYSENANAGVQA